MIRDESNKSTRIHEQVARVLEPVFARDKTSACPLALFDRLKTFAQIEEGVFCEAAALASADCSGAASVRQVLIKDRQERRFTFFTDAGSRKGRDLHENLQVAATFWWRSLGVCYRIEGLCYKASDSVSDARFAQRPALAQASAAVSQQSAVLEQSYADLTKQRDKILRQSRSVSLKRPQRWCGFVIFARSIECWQDQAGRLHHRARWVFNKGDKPVCTGLLSP